MSIALMTAAFKAELPTTAKFVLVALCDSANDQGECYPSIPLLASKCSLTDRGVQKALSDLEAGGYLRREFRNGRSTVYWMTPERGSPHPRTTFTPERRSPPNDVHPTPERDSPPPPNVVHPTPEPCSPITINEPSIEEEKKTRASARPKTLADVDEQVFADWAALRKAKKAPITETAIAGIRREAAKAGLSMQAALEIACQRGWTGFKADWVSGAKPIGAAASFRERDAAAAAENVRQWTGGLLDNTKPRGEVIDMEEATHARIGNG